jgi:hypothetical protein
MKIINTIYMAIAIMIVIVKYDSNNQVFSLQNKMITCMNVNKTDLQQQYRMVPPVISWFITPSKYNPI